MNIKYELIVGVIGSLIIILVTTFYVNQYEKQVEKFKVVTQKNTIAKESQNTNISLTNQEITNHNQENDCWIIIQNTVYNVTQYLKLHPGGRNRIIPFCGKDATIAFDTQGGKGSHSPQANNDLQQLKLGLLNETINTTDTNNQIKNNVKSINSTGREQEYDDD